MSMRPHVSTISLSEELRLLLDAAAAEAGCSRSQVVREGLRRELKRREQVKRRGAARRLKQQPDAA